MKFSRILLSLSLISIMLSCGGNRVAEAESESTGEKLSYIHRRGNFSADSAYAHIERQVSFGPRVPGSEGHKACREYIIETLRKYAADTIIVQDAEVEAFNGTVLPITNILAGFNPEVKRRVLLVAHWDTRPWADLENSRELRDQPIPGANDGGSGVGVLLEIARNFQLRDPEVGVDLLFVDAEDYGNTEGFADNTDTWCLGTQYWVKHMPYPKDAPKPVYGILLDMVGGKNARFHKEMFSNQNAPNLTNRIWAEAARLGYDNIFISSPGGAVTDDHIFLSRAGIPTTDIIETLNETTGTFPPTWHTHSDNLENIDKKSLEAVGRTVLNVIYKEEADS
ncbi:MAG: M28 family peptidase [Muribaculaceae bacterium]|nr:M28 family peptidase [Muribaculaceae bacterium]